MNVQVKMNLTRNQNGMTTAAPLIGMRIKIQKKHVIVEKKLWESTTCEV
jgi:hypothetical protein